MNPQEQYRIQMEIYKLMFRGGSFTTCSPDKEMAKEVYKTAEQIRSDIHG